VTIFGINLGITIGGSLGSAHIGGRGAAKFNSDTKEFEATAKAHIGLGAGLKLGFTISNTKQEIYGQKNKKIKIRTNRPLYDSYLYYIFCNFKSFNIFLLNKENNIYYKN